MVAKGDYCPERGDLVWLDFSPGSGHEQLGKRPALCLSVKEYNEKTGLALFCPCTSAIKGYPYEVSIAGTEKIQGVILADQIKSLDWKARNISFIASLPDANLTDVIAKLSTLLE
jgi:mRNA interferase MazF